MKLEGIDVIARDDRSEVTAIVGRRTHERLVGWRTVIRVHEVSVTVAANLIEQWCAARDAHLIPADVRHAHVARELPHVAGQQPQSAVPSKFVALLEEQLHPKTNAAE